MDPTLISPTGPSSLSPMGYAQTILTFAIMLGLACMVAVGLRTWQRARDRRFHVDDGLIWLGLIFNLAQYSFTAWGTTVGIGTPDSSLASPMLDIAARAIYWVNVANILALGFTKASICTTLLRINSGTSHRKTTWTLWLVMTTICMSTAATLIYSLIQCTPDGQCVSQDRGAWHCFIYPIMTLFILVDMTLALIPVLIIRRLKMKKSLKLSSGAILALGGVACLASILCIPAQIGIDDDPNEQMSKIGTLLFWQNIETGLGIIASCLPMLRRLLKSFDASADDGGAALGRPHYYKPDSSGCSRQSPQSPRNDVEHLHFDSRPSPDRTARHSMALQLSRIINPSPRDSQRQPLRDEELGQTGPA